MSWLSVWLCQQSLHCAACLTVPEISTLCWLGDYAGNVYIVLLVWVTNKPAVSTSCWLSGWLSQQCLHFTDCMLPVRLSISTSWWLCQQCLHYSGCLCDMPAIYMLCWFSGWLCQLVSCGFLKLCQQCLHLSDCAWNVYISVTVLAMSMLYWLSW